MIDYANAVLFTLAALLPIVNPLGSAPIFLSMTADLPGTARRRLAIVVARYAFLLLTAAACSSVSLCLESEKGVSASEGLSASDDVRNQGCAPNRATR